MTKAKTAEVIDFLASDKIARAAAWRKYRMERLDPKLKGMDKERFNDVYIETMQAYQSGWIACKRAHKLPTD